MKADAMADVKDLSKVFLEWVPWASRGCDFHSVASCVVAYLPGAVSIGRKSFFPSNFFFPVCRLEAQSIIGRKFRLL